MINLATNLTGNATITVPTVNQVYLFYAESSIHTPSGGVAFKAKYLSSETNNSINLEIISTGTVVVSSPVAYTKTNTPTIDEVLNQIQTLEFVYNIEGANTNLSHSVANLGTTFLKTLLTFQLSVGIIKTSVTFATNESTDDWSLNNKVLTDYVADSLVIIGDEDSDLGSGIPAFTTIEGGLLDTSKNYLKFIRGSNVVYYQEEIVSASTLKDLVKDNLDNAYIELLFDKYAIILKEDLTVQNKIDILKIATENSLVTYLTSNQIEWYDITGRYAELIDNTETARINGDTYMRAINSVKDVGFLPTDVNDFGEVIAKMLYDIVITKLDTNSNYVYPETVRWLHYIYTRDLSVLTGNSNLNSVVSAAIKDDVYQDYLTESSSSTFYLNNFYPKHYDFIRDRIKYVISIIETNNQNYLYQTTISDLYKIKGTFELLKNVWYGNKNKQTIIDLESSILTFSKQLEFLKKLTVVGSIHF